LLGELYDAAQERLRLGHKQRGRKQRVEAKRAGTRGLLGDKAGLVDTVGALMSDAYWIAEPEDIIARNFQQYEDAERLDERLSIECEIDPERGATAVTVIAQDHPGLFYRIAGGIHLAGATIIDARIHTASNGTAFDNFLVQDRHRQPFSEAEQIERLKKGIRDALLAKVELVQKLAARPLRHVRSKTFKVAPNVTFDNHASNRFTVIEVTARDRPALLNRLAYALYQANLIVHSAHITAYGESAADTFYVTDLIGGKVESAPRLEEIKAALLSAASDKRQRQLEATPS
ncbi:MAG: bifunctional uridylyltransferase/uridylyl-removing protein, partial [Pseudomonadota bacterium]